LTDDRHPLPDLEWSIWLPLEGAGRDARIPEVPGLYRIRSRETGVLLYVGQTGRGLRSRVGALRAIYGGEMPYNDPHTAGPALWAHLQDTDETLEVSVAVVEAAASDRIGREALEITKRRMLDGVSPAYNFGRMPAGWRKSSGNTAKLAAEGKRFRGHRIDDHVPTPSLPPPATLDGDVRGPDWLGLPWQDGSVDPPSSGAQGVYRLGPPGTEALTYLGQGGVRARWVDHTKRWGWEVTSHRHWAPLDVPWPQILEAENDLIAAHVHTFRGPPIGQFGPQRSVTTKKFSRHAPLPPPSSAGESIHAE
jgi:hypothetical protein